MADGLISNLRAIAPVPPSKEIKFEISFILFCYPKKYILKTNSYKNKLIHFFDRNSSNFSINSGILSNANLFF